MSYFLGALADGDRVFAIKAGIIEAAGRQSGSGDHAVKR